MISVPLVQSCPATDTSRKLTIAENGTRSGVSPNGVADYEYGQYLQTIIDRPPIIFSSSNRYQCSAFYLPFIAFAMNLRIPVPQLVSKSPDKIIPD